MAELAYVPGPQFLITNDSQYTISHPYLPLLMQGTFPRQTNTGNTSIDPVIIPSSRSVTLSLAAVNPDADFSFH